MRISGSTGPAGTGVLISDRHVLTSRRWPAGEHTGTTVHLVDGTEAVGRILLPQDPAVDAAVLLLAAPVRARPLRPGFPRLTHIGDPVQAVWFGAEPAAGLVEKFEAFPEHGLHLVKTDLRLPPDAAGGALLNELGEVVGVLAPRDEEQPAYAVILDSLAPLLAGADFGTTGEPR